MKQHQPPKAKQHTLYQPKRRVLSLKSTAWRKLRAQVLQAEPLCRLCMEDYDWPTPATDVDHIDGDGDNNSLCNLQPLCHSCHSIKTRHEMMRKERKVVGCDVDGWPLDPDHGWNSEKITRNRPEVDRAPSHENAAAGWEF